MPREPPWPSLEWRLSRRSRLSFKRKNSLSHNMCSNSLSQRGCKDQFCKLLMQKSVIPKMSQFSTRFTLMSTWTQEWLSLDQMEPVSQLSSRLLLESSRHSMERALSMESVPWEFSPNITWRCLIQDSQLLNNSIENGQRINPSKWEDILDLSVSPTSLLSAHLPSFLEVRNLAYHSRWSLTRPLKFYYWMSQQIIWTMMPSTLWLSLFKITRVVWWWFPMTSTSLTLCATWFQLLIMVLLLNMMELSMTISKNCVLITNE